MCDCKCNLARQHGAREDELAWLAERDNLVLVHSTRDEAWQVRRASSGEVRGQGNTPRAALQAAMIPAAPATDVGEGPAYEYGYTWGPEEGPGDTDVHVPAAPEANPGEVK